MTNKGHQYTSYELAMRAVLLLQKSRTRDTQVAVSIIRGAFPVSRATAYRIVAHAGAAMGFNYHREQYVGHASHSVGYPRLPYPQADTDACR